MAGKDEKSNKKGNPNVYFIKFRKNIFFIFIPQIK